MSGDATATGTAVTVGIVYGPRVWGDATGVAAGARVNLFASAGAAVGAVCVGPLPDAAGAPVAFLLPVPVPATALPALHGSPTR